LITWRCSNSHNVASISAVTQAPANSSAAALLRALARIGAAS
jgi:hypothetical protein